MKLFVDPPQVYLHRDFVDFRKSINGLAAIVETDMALPTMSGALFANWTHDLVSGDTYIKYLLL